MTDYRVVGNNNPFNNIDSKKKELQKTLKSDHPRAKNHYKFINNINSEYNQKFASIYGKRCAYCGIDYNIKSHENFVVDHFICKASGGGGIDHLSNLVYTCDYCNKKKRDFKIPKKDSKILNPDQELGKTFYRDEMFHIKIFDIYKDNDSVVKFYSKMNFDYERRRLEYLMLAIDELHSTIQDKDKKYHLSEIFKKLKKHYFCGIVERKK